MTRLYRPDYVPNESAGYSKWSLSRSSSRTSSPLSSRTPSPTRTPQQHRYSPQIAHYCCSSPNHSIENLAIDRIPRRANAKAILIAELIHENWRKNSGYATRVKPVRNDIKWISMYGTTCDIQNTTFKRLPSDWKRDSYECAVHAIEIVTDVQDVDIASALLHKKWLEHHQSADPHLKVPFHELSAKEQDKNRYIIRLVLEYMV